jgi:lipoyl(octanoyl) transferase
MPLDCLKLGLEAYFERLHDSLLAILGDFSIHGHARFHHPGVWVGGRPIACVGIAVRNWVTYYGAALNLNPDLEPFRLVRCGGAHGTTMTSLERERRGPVRPALVRERLIEHFAKRFGFMQTHLFFDSVSLVRKAPSDAIVASS